MTQTNYTIQDLYVLWLETKELVKNRPDAVCTSNNPKGRSIYQRKLANIKRAAQRMTPTTKNDEIFISSILGRPAKIEEEVVKVQWFPRLELL